MTKTITITLTYQSSKAEELEVLTKIANAIPQGTYLADLFNPRLITWVKHQMDMDRPGDLMDALEHGEKAHQEEVGKWQKERAGLEHEIERAKVQVAQGEQRLADREAEASDLRMQISTLQKALEAKREQIASLDLTTDALAQNAAEQQKHACELAQANAHLEAKIRDLKIRIYDLEHPEA